MSIYPSPFIATKITRSRIHVNDTLESVLEGE